MSTDGDTVAGGSPVRSRVVSKRGSSQQSLNHLLNFSLPPRERPQLQHLPRRSKKTGSQQVWNKEKFVNAQYRFMMKPTGDYTVHFADPDIFFQWQDILQVIIPRTSGTVSEHTTCPICLSPPNAPRMTKCGHVFCFSCILHYLQMGENPKWNRCPICFDSVSSPQLRSVRWSDTQPSGMPQPTGEYPHLDDYGGSALPKPGTLVHMRLMERPQITTLALPRSATWPSDLIPPHRAPFHFLPDVATFAKFMLATPSQLVVALTQDLDELELEKQDLTRLGDNIGVTFVDAAMEKIARQIEKAQSLEKEMGPLAFEQERLEREMHGLARLSSERSKRLEDTSASSPLQHTALDEFLNTQSQAIASSPQTTLLHAANATRTSRQRRNVNPPPPSTSTYYYFQSANGLPIFLHPLDIRILHAHFKSYPSFPNDIMVRVSAASEGTINDDLRKRCKYLQHFPEAADVIFVEVEKESLEDLVGAEGIQPFENALRTRETKRREKTKKDDRARIRHEEQQREKEFQALGSNLQRWGTSFPRSESPHAEEMERLDEQALTSTTSPKRPAEVSGAWGSRSFATALNTSGSVRAAQPSRSHVSHEDDAVWEVDEAWRGLEEAQRSRSGGGKKKGRQKLVLIGSGAGGRRH